MDFMINFTVISKNAKKYDFEVWLLIGGRLTNQILIKCFEKYFYVQRLVSVILAY